MKTVVLDTPSTVVLSALSSTLPIGVCKDLLSPRGVVMKDGDRYFVGELDSRREIPTTTYSYFYKSSFIEELIRTGYMVIQFDSSKEMYAWLGDEFVETH